ncbi:MAG: amidohydrolase [Bryobacterales bacterium]|nr:amidohydrolase [Bryobacterales bacterium]
MNTGMKALCVAALMVWGAHGADAVYFNGKVITMGAGPKQTQAFLVEGNRFTKVGTNDEVLKAAKPRTPRIDLRGRTVVPGLNDSHTHPIGAAMAEQEGEVPVMASITEVQAYVKRIAATTPASKLIFVPKVYSTRLKERRYPTRWELDEVSGDHETMTDNSYASVLNSKLLKRLGVDRNTPQPGNGKIIKDDKGEPTGLILGAQQLLGPLRASRAFTYAERMAGLRKMQSAYNRVGITSTGDRGQGPEGFRLYQDLKQRGQLTVRTAVTYMVQGGGKPEDLEKRIEAIPFVTGWGDEWLRVGPLKTVVDGGILIGTAYLREPYGMNTQVYGYVDPDYRGVLNVPRENLVAMAKTANRLGWQMTSHTTGGGAIDLLLDAYEEANKEKSILGRRFTVTHGNFPNGDAIAKAARLGVVFDCQPQWHHFDGPALGPVFGPERTKWFLPLRAMIDAGVVVAGGSDHMIKYDPRKSINAYHPFYAMWMTITRKTADDAVLGPEQRITREEALRLWTVNGAYLTFEEKVKGSVEAGKLADFVVIDRDFLTVPEEQIKAIEPVRTVVDGNVVYDTGVLGG